MSRWFIERRQEFIGRQLELIGWINRADLARHFDISICQASVDLRTFKAANPGAMTYDLSTKRYVRGEA